MGPETASECLQRDCVPLWQGCELLYSWHFKRYWVRLHGTVHSTLLSQSLQRVQLAPSTTTLHDAGQFADNDLREGDRWGPSYSKPPHTLKSCYLERAFTPLCSVLKNMVYELGLTSTVCAR